MRNIFLVLFFLTMCGCEYHWQSKNTITPITYNAASYRSADSVGKLRRLALMPFILETYKGRYLSAKDQGDAELSYGETCERFLTDKKGYEIVVVRDTDEKWPSSLLENLGYDTIQDLHKEWHKERAEKHAASVIQTIGAALNVDGVLVIFIKERKPWGITEGLLNLAFVNIPLFYNLATPDTGAWIYETATGQLVWREESSCRPPDGNEGIHPSVTDCLIRLFADLENALPRQLIK